MGLFDEWYVDDDVDAIGSAANLPVAYDFRSRFLYNNSIFSLAGNVIAQVMKQSMGQVMKEYIFEPLGMSRTFTSTDEYDHKDGDDNYAKGYTVLDNGTQICRGYPGLGASDAQGAAGCVRSSVNDMLKWASAVMKAELLAAHGKTSDLLPGIEYTRMAHRPIVDENWLGENTYGMGWFRHTIPSRMLGCIGPSYNNRLYGDEPPVINAGPDSRPRVTIAHWGEYQGFLAAFYTLPETHSAVVVLANSSMSRGDPTDLIAQLILQELFTMTPKVDLVAYARRAVTEARQDWPNLIKEWELARSTAGITAAPPATDFVGIYRNAGLRLTINVFEPDNNSSVELPAALAGNDTTAPLAFQVNGLSRQVALLRHFHHDAWTWLPASRDDAVRSGAEFYLNLQLLVLAFTRNAMTGRVVALEWDIQGGGACEGPAPRLGEIVKPVRFEREVQ